VPTPDQGTSGPGEARRIVVVPLESLSALEIRMACRGYAYWLFAGGGIAAIGLLLPQHTFVLRLLGGGLFLSGMILAAIHVPLINGAVAELARRRNDRDPPLPDESHEDEVLDA
jgi:hypothetical protein